MRVKLETGPSRKKVEGAFFFFFSVITIMQRVSLSLFLIYLR